MGGGGGSALKSFMLCFTFFMNVLLRAGSVGMGERERYFVCQ